MEGKHAFSLGGKQLGAHVKQFLQNIHDDNEQLGRKWIT